MTAEYRDVRVRARGSVLEVSLSVRKQIARNLDAREFFAGLRSSSIPNRTYSSRKAHGRRWPVTLPPGAAANFEISIPFPPEAGAYEIYVSHIQPPDGWAYARGEPFLRILVEAAADELAKLRVLGQEITTVRSLRLRRMWAALPKLFASPLRTIAQNHRLIRSMARRDILARYRGSFGDVFWTVLNPLLLMATYFFVFGIVLQSRFAGDQSRTGFALYFLAGMLPWLAFSEPVGRAASVILEHRNFVKKLVFPLDTLPVNQVVAGLVTELFAAGVFVAAC